MSPTFVRILCGGTLVLSVAACRSGDVPERRDRNDETGRNVAAPVAAQSAHGSEGDSPAAARAPEPNRVEFPDNVDWRTWEEGLALAKQQSKPLLVVVYAHWCPKCRTLAPIFGRPDIAELSKRFIMVRQDQDEAPGWLAAYNEKFGGYVPRVFFFDSSGKLREDVTSGHPRYPYFYAAQQPEFLVRAMRQAVGS